MAGPRRGPGRIPEKPKNFKGTILHADQILVLDGGRIVGRGTHGALLRSCETYREIALSQLSAAELGEEG